MGINPHALGWALVMAGRLWLDWLLRCCCISAILCLAPKSCLRSEVVDKWHTDDGRWKSEIQIPSMPKTIHNSMSMSVQKNANFYA